MGRKEEVRELAMEYGLFLATWSPGDGMTRYRFFLEPKDYFSDDGIYTALGAKESEVFLAGFARGKAAGRGGY